MNGTLLRKYRHPERFHGYEGMHKMLDECVIQRLGGSKLFLVTRRKMEGYLIPRHRFLLHCLQLGVRFLQRQ